MDKTEAWEQAVAAHPDMDQAEFIVKYGQKPEEMLTSAQRDQQAAKKALTAYAQVAGQKSTTALKKLPVGSDLVDAYQKQFDLADADTVQDLKDNLRTEALNHGVDEEAFEKFQEKVEPKANLLKQGDKGPDKGTDLER